ncbi:NERD domain-containing protein [Rossellomorea marisflavi]|uniref:NERD domain-containing protein n=1 Tax=Rossellomorea marisflavi TaxID=189381 RepID=UPI0027A2C63F|nr:NERD domain-containing protein [Rossellomorea marisflavi]UTE74047.1 NERD domain-containing protein [Rossellomorea marisflavi]
MAQLIKLQDYISRYEMDLYRYPTQFVRLKKQQWEKMKDHWENGDSHEEALSAMEEKETVKDRLFSFFKRRGDQEEIEDLTMYAESDDEEEFAIDAERVEASTEDELKQVFLENIMDFQLKWASSTISQRSYVDNSYYYDERLKYLLQRFPDNILVLYHPILKIKKAPVEFETILITPTAVWCLTFLEFEEGTAYIGGKDHFWLKKWGREEEKVLNPLITLQRMETIIDQILRFAGVDLPIHKGVICRNGYIDYPQAPHHVHLLDKRKHEGWFESLRSISSPIKGVQLKAAQAILDYGHTTSFKRIGMDEDRFVGEEP